MRIQGAAANTGNRQPNGIYRTHTHSPREQEDGLIYSPREQEDGLIYSPIEQEDELIYSPRELEDGMKETIGMKTCSYD